MPIIINQHGFAETNVVQPHDTGFPGMSNCFATGAGKIYDGAFNICANNNLWASTHSTSDGVTQELRALNGNWPTIPTASIINGVQVTFLCFATSTSFEFDIRLIVGGVKVGANRSQAQNWNGQIFRGGSTDLWGTTLTAAQVNAGDFGASVQHVINGGGKYFYGTQFLLVRIFYTS